MKALLIMNPGSRSGRGRKLWPFWESGLKKNGITFDSVITENSGSAVELARNAVNYDTVIAAGGDGTINEVLDGVIQSGRKNLKMGVLYSGTSPDFCGFHGIPVLPAAAVETVNNGRACMVDVAEITYKGKDGEKILSHFGCGCNIGLGPAVARVSNSIRKFTGDTLGTYLALIRAITSMKPMDLELAVDGSSLSLSGVNNLSILKNPYIASGLRLNLDLAVNDGKLALFVVQGKSRLSIFSILPGFYSGKAAGRKDMFCQVCSSVTITCKQEREIEFDGDPRGFLPVEIKILPEALNLIGAGK